jgi:uncharacterized protein
MIFEWDPTKAWQNVRKHKVSFEEAATVFLDPLATTFDDPDHSKAEHRYITIGWSNQQRVLFVAHADRGVARIRIITARQATRREKHDYSEIRPRS